MPDSPTATPAPVAPNGEPESAAVPGLDLSHTEPAIRIQDDLFGHFNGQWLATAEIPADRSSDGVFYSLRDAAELNVKAIVEDAAAHAQPGSLAAKVGDLYASFMDTAAIASRGRTPLEADLAAVAAIRDKDALYTEMIRLQAGGVGGFVAPFVNTDAGDASRYTIYLEQSGLGLPDESYYREEQFADIRTRYRAHIARMLVLGAGLPGEQATAAADHILAVETDLAAAHWNSVACRDAVKTYNPMSLADAAALAPALRLPEWLSGMGVPADRLANVVVRQPSFLAGAGQVLTGQPLEAWKWLLTWQVVNATASLLDDEMVQANFDFYGTVLSGTPKLRERWKRGVSLVEGAMGEAVGELYVAAHFPPSAKAAMERLVANLVAAYRASISQLPWMTEPTRERALAKLDAFTPKVGYADHWRDYTELQIDRCDLVGNARRSYLLQAAHEWAKLGGPVDRGEWFMTPQTVNAYYNPGMNEIVFPAAILQPPFFDSEVDDAINYGAIGAVIGHEIGHGFDDQGSRYDGDGNLSDWWTEEDRERFDALAQALIEQYSQFRPRDLPEPHRVNGALTVGENIGDLGGLAVALEAYELSLGGAPAPVIGGLSGRQRFFLAWAQAWRGKTREAEEIRRLTVDPHSPAEFRCNVVRNLPAFVEAFALAPGDGLWLDPAQRVRIW
ncbi:MAG: M13 family metallopeptidase [Candidatus Nanopelagicales bacterium]